MPNPALRNSIIIVNHNTKLALARLLESLNLPEALATEAIVIDNNSSDGSADMVAEKFPAVRLIRMESNRGFAAAVNRGVNAAGGDISIICHADLVVSSLALADLADHVRAAEGRRVVAAVPRLVGAHGADQPNLGPLPTLGRSLAAVFKPPIGRSVYPPYLDHLANHEWASTACFAIDTGAFVQMGGMDEGLFLYYADADLCQRLHDTRHRVLVFRELRVIHTGSMPDAPVPHHLARLMRKDQMTFFAKHHPAWEKAMLCGAAKIYTLVKRDDTFLPGPKGPA